MVLFAAAPAAAGYRHRASAAIPAAARSRHSDRVAATLEMPARLVRRLRAVSGRGLGGIAASTASAQPS